MLKEEIKSSGKSKVATPSKNLEQCAFLDKDGLIEIIFYPEDNGLIAKEDDEVNFVSEFNGWNLEKLDREIRKNKVAYVKKFRMEPGYKHKFRFLLNGNPIIDMDYPKLISPKNIGLNYNYIYILNEEDILDIPLLSKKDSYANPAVILRN